MDRGRCSESVRACLTRYLAAGAQNGPPSAKGLGAGGHPRAAAAGLSTSRIGWTRTLAICALLVGVAAGALAAGDPDEAGSPALHWRIRSRELPTLGWRQGLTHSARQGLWLGGVSDSTSPGGKLLRMREDGTWSEEGGHLRGSRAYVLDADPAGTVWVATYTPLDAETYAGLKVYRSDGDGWLEHEVEPGIWPQAIQAVAEDEVWIAGNRGLLLHYRSGRWRRVQVTDRDGRALGEEILGLRMPAPGAGWAVGSRGLVARYQGGGWVAVDVPAWLQGQQLKGVDVASDGAVWMVGTSGLIARRTSEGWARFPSPVAADLTAINMTGSNDGWAVGFEGVILRFDGARWHDMPSPTRLDLNAIEMAGPAEGWIAGEGVVLEASQVAPRFVEVSERAFYRDALQPARAASAVDLDGDGRVEIALLSETKISVFGNARGQGFEQLWATAAPGQEAGSSLISAAWGDLTGDARPDLLLLQAGAGDLLFFSNQRGRNHRGRGLRRSRLEGVEPGRLSPGDTAYFLDVDLDGRLDLYLSRSFIPGPSSVGNVLYLQGADGALRRAGPQDRGKGIENLALWGDLNGDRAPDVFLPGFNQEELTLLLNDGGGRMVDATAEAGLDLGDEEGIIRQAALADLDNDGDLDLLFLQESLHLFVNDGAARFQADPELRALAASNPAEDHGGLLAVADVDHDGSLDILFQPTDEGRTLRLLSRGSRGHFRDVTKASGLADLRGQSALFADLDGDGDLDLLLTATTGAGSRVFENRQDDQAYLEVRLRGGLGNRLGVGATVALYQGTVGASPRRLIASRQVGLGSNPAGFTSLTELHFGLPESGPYEVEVVFPGGRRIVRQGIEPGTRLVVDELPVLAGAASRTLQRLRRAWCDGSLPGEARGLVLVVLLLAGWRRVAPRRLQAWRIANRRGSVLALLALWTGVAVFGLVGPLPSIGIALRFALLAFGLGLLTVLDQSLSRGFSERQIGPYRIEAHIGSGAMGEVYRARHVVAGGPVAVKVVHGLPGGSAGQQGVLRLEREAAVLRRLDHPAIVKILDNGSIGRRFWLAMELLEGESLAARIERDGPLPIPLCERLLRALAGALDHAHCHGILHRDLSSTNVFLTHTAPGIRLMDFGLAHADEAAPLTQRSALVGTLAYMAPELFEGGSPAARTDLYALGAVTYEALTGRLVAFRSPSSLLGHSRLAGTVVSPSALRQEVPEILDRIVQRLLAPAAEDRFASVKELLAALDDGSLLPVHTDSPDQLADVWPGDGKASGDVGWRRLFARARREQAQGRAVRAEALMVDCLEELMTRVDAESAESGRDEEVQEVLAFMARLRW